VVLPYHISRACETSHSCMSTSAALHVTACTKPRWRVPAQMCGRVPAQMCGESRRRCERIKYLCTHIVCSGIEADRRLSAYVAECGAVQAPLCGKRRPEVRVAASPTGCRPAKRDRPKRDRQVRVALSTAGSRAAMRSPVQCRIGTVRSTGIRMHTQCSAVQCSAVQRIRPPSALREIRATGRSPNALPSPVRV
jgi:hypothetical protein